MRVYSKMQNKNMQYSVGSQDMNTKLKKVHVRLGDKLWFHKSETSALVAMTHTDI